MPTNDYSKNIVYLSKEQYQELIANETLTVNGQTITYNDNDIYVTPQAEPVTDVKINGTSVATNGVANVPMIGIDQFGVGKLASNTGILVNPSGILYIKNPSNESVRQGVQTYEAVTLSYQHQSAFYGLAKAAGADMKNVSDATVGTYPDAQKAAIQNMLGITDLISTEETTTATAAHALNSTFMMNGKLHRATTAIAIGDAVEVGTNCEVVKVEDVFVKKTDYASNSAYGIVKSDYSHGITSVNGILEIYPASINNIKTSNDEFKPITANYAKYAAFYGLAKAAGDTSQASSNNTVGTYTDDAKSAIRAMLGVAAASDIPSVPVQDVQVNGTSVLSNGVANVPVGNNSILGVIQGNASEGVGVTNAGKPYIQNASVTQIKAGLSVYSPITPSNQDASAFYALAKLAGVDMASSSNPVGTYTNEAKIAIRTMLGAASPDVVAISDTQPTNADTKVWLPETQAAGVEVPTMADMNTALAGKVSDVQVNGTSVVTNGVANVPIADGTNPGVVKVVRDTWGLFLHSTQHYIGITKASDAYVKAGSNSYNPIVPNNQHQSVFYGLAKAAGDTTQSQSDNAVGTYTADASAAIRNMIGAVGDVQVNETSIVSNGIANIPVASTSTLGVVGIGGSFGIKINENGKLYVDTAGLNAIKSGNVPYSPISAMNQHQSVFYGLAKAAGDATQSASDNAVGTYTTEAKAAIQSMLGIDLQSIASEVEIPLVETVSGTTPSITGQPNTRYICGEVSTLSITPPSAGSIDVIFDSGSTPAVITVPNTVRWPAWFDATALEADTTYEILITDGAYGSVMTWAN